MRNPCEKHLFTFGNYEVWLWVTPELETLWEIRKTGSTEQLKAYAELHQAVAAAKALDKKRERENEKLKAEKLAERQRP